MLRTFWVLHRARPTLEQLSRKLELARTMSIGQRQVPHNAVTSASTSSSSFSVTDILQPSSAADEATTNNDEYKVSRIDDLSHATEATNALTPLLPYRTSHAPVAPHDAGAYANTNIMTSMGAVNGAAYNYMTPPSAYSQYNSASDISHFAESMRPSPGWGYPSSGSNYPRKFCLYFDPCL